MAIRRSLVDRMKTKPPADRLKEEEFVYGQADQSEPEKPKQKAEVKEKREGEGLPPTPVASQLPAITGRSPLTTRIRSDLATALKRASLERQLSGEKPNTVQDILEEALQPWLKGKGYLKE